MSEKVVQLVNNQEERAACGMCRLPLTEKVHELTSDAGDVRYICDPCAKKARQSPEQIREYWQAHQNGDRAKAKNLIRCKDCEEMKSEGIRTLAEKVEGAEYEYKLVYICESCIDRKGLSPEERMTLNRIEMWVKDHLARISQ